VQGCKGARVQGCKGARFVSINSFNSFNLRKGVE